MTVDGTRTDNWVRLRHFARGARLRSTVRAEDWLEITVAIEQDRGAAMAAARVVVAREVLRAGALLGSAVAGRRGTRITALRAGTTGVTDVGIRDAVP